MDALAGPYLASAVLLVVAGATKLLDPVPLMRALSSVGWSARRSVVRTGALVEVVLGAAAVIMGTQLAAIGVALSYAAFTGFVLRGMSRGGVLASCGCFGKDDTPPTRTHVIVTAVAALVAVAVAVRPLGGLAQMLDQGVGTALALIASTAAVAVLSYLVLARLPVLSRRVGTARGARA